MKTTDYVPSGTEEYFRGKLTKEQALEEVNRRLIGNKDYNGVLELALHYNVEINPSILEVVAMVYSTKPTSAALKLAQRAFRKINRDDLAQKLEGKVRGLTDTELASSSGQRAIWRNPLCYKREQVITLPPTCTLQF